MFNQEDLTAFANQFGLYIDIRPCEECLNPKGNSEHGFDCDEYKAIYGWVESRAREQIKREIEAEKKWCDCEVINGYIHAFGCSREFAKKRAAAIAGGNG